jgi:uncharacterized membrane protein
MKWLLGGIGFLLGLAMSRLEDALGWLVLGFLAGGFIDFLRRPRNPPAPAADTSDIARIDAALADIHWRLKRLEEAGALGLSPLQQGVAFAAPDAGPPQVDTAFAPQASVAEGSARLPEPDLTVPNSAAADTVMSTVPPEVVEPEPPRAPSPFDFAWRWFTSGNTVVKVGIVVLFFGVGFLIKYAAEHALLPIELRLVGVVLFAIGLLVQGWRLTRRHAPGAGSDASVLDDQEAALARMKVGYGLLLQGAAVGLLYLTVFGAFKLYHLLPGTLAFGLMGGIVVLSAILALKQDSLPLAAFGSAGGFLAPILASSGGGSHVGLFSFYALLNAGIVAIAWHKAWRVLNLLGFIFTFGIATVWGINAYRPELFATTEPFLLLFFAMYVGITILFATREAPRLRSYVDGTLLFGTPIVAFGLQAALMRETPFGAAFSAVAMAAFYLLLAAGVRARAPDTLRLLFESFLALGVVFATLAVPLALDGRWTSAVWAVEGAAVVWAGMRQARLPARLFGYLVMAGAALAFITANENWRQPGDIPLANAAFVGCVLIALSALFVARLIDGVDADDARVGTVERMLGWVFALWGAFWWLAGGVAEIDRWLAVAHAYNATALFLAASAAAATGASRRWPRARLAVLALLPLMTVVACGALAANRHPFAAWGWIEWPLALALHYALLRGYERDERPGLVAVPSLMHALGVWLITLLAVAELHHLTNTQALERSVWSAAAAALPLVAMTLWLTSRTAASMWPVAAHLRAYLLGGLAPLLALGWAWMFVANIGYDGHSGPLPYMPFLNALDLMHAFILIAFVSWWRALAREGIAPPLPRQWLLAALAAALFFWLNAVLLRTLHHWGGVPYRFDAMMRSMLVQAALSIFWTVLALALMWFANRRAQRTLWVVGACLMGAVVGKLFLVDQSNIGGIERIVSFIAVGLLMLGIGYFTPLPPRRTDGEAT